MTLLTADDIRHLRTGAHFLACCVDPTAIHIYAEKILSALDDGQISVIPVSDLDPTDLVVAIGIVNKGFFLTDLPPVGDEFSHCLAAIEASLGRKVSAIYSLAAANVNGIIPLMVGLQLDLPIVDSDPMGRVFPLISQTTLNIGHVGISPIAMMGPAGESALVQAQDPQRAERLVRAIVGELGGWAATAMYPCQASDLAEHGIHGSITRMIRIGEILDTDESAESKYLSLVHLLAASRIARARVILIEQLSRPTDLGLPAQPSSVTLLEESSGRIIRLEIQNEILLVQVDGGVAAAVPDIVTLLSSEHGTTVRLEDVQMGSMLDVLVIPASPKWYSPPGLKLAGPTAFNIPLRHPRSHA